MPELDGIKYGYDEEGMREYMKAKNAKSKAKYGRSHFPMDEGGNPDDKFKMNVNPDDETTDKNILEQITDATKSVDSEGKNILDSI